MEGALAITGGQFIAMGGALVSAVVALFWALMKEKDGRREDAVKNATDTAKIATDSAMAINEAARSMDALATKVSGK